MSLPGSLLILTACLLLPACTVLDPPVGSTTRRAASDATMDASLEGGMACGKISSVGCCDGQTLWWCHEGALKKKSCAAAPTCGWSNTGIYDCNTSGVADPSGKHYMPCKALTGDSGVPASDTAPASDGGGCQGIKEEGCCAGDTLKYCEGGKLKTLRCELNPRCGWLANGQYYDCGTAGAADPAGKHPKACPGTTLLDLGPDQTPDGTGDAVLDTLGGDGPGEGGGCTCDTGRGTPSLLLLLLLVLLALRREGRQARRSLTD